ncbi:MAG TPA: hypothetical protein VFL13_01135 [Candidatus Baltobacteraceae bacterium]|nr:hypothetical protein [Candidatus Baltobacteraceae bacterium]
MRKLAACIFALTLAACGGGGGGNTSAPPPSGTTQDLPPPPTNAPVNTALMINGEENVVNGDNTWYSSGTASWSNHAGSTAGAPSGNAVDGSTCTNVSEGSQYPQSDFSQHIFVGIYANGVEEALPQAIGMVDPKPPTTPAPPDWPSGHPNDNYPVELSQCRYNVHSHDYSGLVHIEDMSVAQSNTSMPAYANLQTLFDVWGAQFSANGIVAGGSTLSGRAIVYVGTPSGKNGTNDLVTSYTLYNGSLSSLQFSKHMAIWIVIGALPSSGLPEVQIVQTN